jgi:hypothetical protein
VTLDLLCERSEGRRTMGDVACGIEYDIGGGKGSRRWAMKLTQVIGGHDDAILELDSYY